MYVYSVSCFIVMMCTIIIGLTPPTQAFWMSNVAISEYWVKWGALRGLDTERLYDAV